jgi:hypothetical protein
MFSSMNKGINVRTQKARVQQIRSMFVKQEATWGIRLLF